MITKKVKCICAVHRSADANYSSKIAVEMARSRRFYRYFIGGYSLKRPSWTAHFTQYERPGIPHEGAASARYAR